MKVPEKSVPSWNLKELNTDYNFEKQLKLRQGLLMDDEKWRGRDT